MSANRHPGWLGPIIVCLAAALPGCDHQPPEPATAAIEVVFNSILEDNSFRTRPQ
jgi:hypothetical protein